MAQGLQTIGRHFSNRRKRPSRSADLSRSWKSLRVFRLIFHPCDRMVTAMHIMDFVAAVGAVAALLGAVFGYVNGRDIRALKGRVDEISRILTKHVSAPGLHR